MFLTADIVVETSEAVLIPIESVQRFQGKDFIFLQTAQNEFEAMEIQVRQTNADYVTVSNADAKSWIGKSLVVKNAFSLLGVMMNKSD
jgi:cobalt-zinc-cadmium efflux system membrane fusion protein